jgi:vacuolar-type H+-ATPase subunit I/STV1
LSCHFYGMGVHIGEKIRLRAKELRIGPTELGKKIHTSKQNITGIYKRRSLDAELLSKFSRALHFDFFQFYQQEGFTTAEEGAAGYGKKNKMAQLQEEVQKLKKELNDLHEKYELLKKLNALLEKKRKN